MTENNTNEEIALLIQGGAGDLLPVLWENTRGLVEWWARRWMTAFCNRNDVEMDDLISSGYIAMHNAAFTFSGENGARFSTWMSYHIKAEFRRTYNVHTIGAQEDALNGAVSFHQSTQSETEGLELIDQIEDLTQSDELITVEDRIYQEQLRRCLDRCLDLIGTKKASIIRARYFEGLAMSAIGKRYGMSSSAVRDSIVKGLRAMREGGAAEKLIAFDERFNFYGNSSKAMSIQDKYIIQKEWYTGMNRKRKKHGDKHGDKCGDKGVI